MRDLGRRRFLRGAGGVAVGLPFLLSKGGDTRAATAPPRQRLITFYYGNGLPPEIAAEGYEGTLAPLAPHAAKLTMVRQIEAMADGPFGNGHVKGSAAFACAMDFKNKRTKGGPSLDWVVHGATGTDTPLQTLSTGIYGADDAHERMRIVHSWRGIDQPNEPISSTLELFHHLFGGAELFHGDADAARLARYRVSVLDSVVGQYRHLVGDCGGLDAAGRQVLSGHLDHVRALEKRALDLDRVGGGAHACQRPGEPQALDALSRRTLDNWDHTWPILVDLYVLALRCDLVRFGNLMVTSGGDRFPFEGTEGKLDNVHADAYHRWPKQNGPILRACLRWTAEKIAHFLARMDDPTFLDVDGGTLLDNTTVLIGTELGDPAPHSRKEMTYFIGGARGRFQRGVHDLPGGNDVELYNTILRGLGIDRPFGDGKHVRRMLPIVA